jgi:hypothetical protein
MQVMLQRRAILLLVAALSVLQSGSKVAIQLELATAIILVNLVAHLWVRPYKDANLNRLGALGLLSVRVVTWYM